MLSLNNALECTKRNLFFSFGLSVILENSTSSIPPLNSTYNISSGNSITIPPHLNLKRKIILLWTKTKHLDPFRKAVGKNKRGSCLLTADKSKYKVAEGILFVLWPKSWNGSVPPARFPWQYYAFVTNEAGARSIFNDERFNNTILPVVSQPGFFNLTSTFRKDSDFPMPYLFTKKTEPKGLKTKEQILKSKTKLMLWLVSHCNTHSKRETYIEEIKKHIPVHVYGKCGNQACYKNHACGRRLLENYKFYFSAENTLCKDYVTEKLLRPLETFVVPVVYATKSVHKIAPPHSYIDVRDFKSPKHLADYLLYLDKNHTAYMAYFQWKKHYKVIGRQTAGHEPTFRQFCSYLHYNHKPRVLWNFTDWFYVKSECETPHFLPT